MTNDEERRAIVEDCFLLQPGGSKQVPQYGFTVHRWDHDWWILWTTPMSHVMPFGQEFATDLDFRAFMAGNMKVGRKLTRETDGYMGPLQ